MKTLVLAAATAATLLAGSLTPAAASGGCGPFGHRGYDGFCHQNPRPYGVYGGYGYGYRRPFYGYGYHPYGGGYGWHRHDGWRGY